MKLIYSTIFFLTICLSIQAQEWVEATSLPNAFSKTHHSFAFELEGMGYIVTGGSDTGNRDDFYQYNPTEDEWTQLDDFPGNARSFAIGDTWDGKAYFGFGSFGSTSFNDLWVFDPADMSWTELESCPCLTRTHPAFIAQNGKIFMGLGGSDDGNLNDWWVYDMASNSWERKSDFPAEPRHHPYQFGIDDYIYAGFGHGASIYNDWYRYDPAIDEWQQMASLPAEGRVAGTQFSYGGKGYILSGDGEDHQSMDTGEFWSYTPEANLWLELPAHPAKSRWAPASFIIDGEVYLMNGDSYVDEQFVYQEQVYKYTLEEISPVEYVEDKSLFEVFPNPFSNQINLKWTKDLQPAHTTISIYDIDHKLVFKTHGWQETLSLSDLPKGLLRVEVSDGQKRYFQTVVKQ